MRHLLNLRVAMYNIYRCHTKRIILKLTYSLISVIHLVKILACNQILCEPG